MPSEAATGDRVREVVRLDGKSELFEPESEVFAVDVLVARGDAGRLRVCEHLAFAVVGDLERLGGEFDDDPVVVVRVSPVTLVLRGETNECDDAVPLSTG